LDILRAGVAIEKGKPGSAKVRTSPARIRQVRQGDNPWYEVVLIEGRNRELRKMFEEVGHFVEKIRRVGYGPLILDQEPGHLRELDAQELELLRKAADGKLKTPKAKEIRRRNIVDSLPADKPAFKPRGAKPAAGPKDYKPKKAFGTDRPVRSGSGPAKFASGPKKFGEAAAKFGPRPTVDAPAARPAWKKDDRSSGATGRPTARFVPRSTEGESPSAGKSFADRPSAGRTFGAKPGAGAKFGGKPAGRTFAEKPGTGKPFGDKPAGRREFPAKPAWKKLEGQQWPEYKRPPVGKPEARRRPAPEPVEDLEPRRPIQLHIEPIHETERARPERPASSRSGSDRGGFKGSAGRSSGPSRTGAGRPSSARTGSDRSGSERSGAGRSSAPRPFRSEGGLARPFTTSSGKPRPGGARPSSKPGKPGSRPYGAGSGAVRSGPRTEGSSRPSFGPKRPFDGPRKEGGAPSRPFRSEGGEGSRPERKTGTGWKPKPNFAGGSKTGSGGSSRPKSGGFSKPGGFKSGGKGRPSSGGPKLSGPKPGGKRRP
jgi:23S rRNA pseudouridine2605 synthase